MSYSNLDFADKSFQPIAKSWLFIAILSLAIAGLFSLPPVILRGSFFEQFFDIQHVFDMALMIHVNLSVLVWMFAINSLLLCYIARQYITFYQASHRVALVGCLFMAFSPFIGESIAYKNNYIPILHNLLFLIGLGLFACSIVFQSVLTLCQYHRQFSALEFGLFTSACITLSGLVCFIIANALMSETILQDRLYFYELLFWGGGHIIQLTYTVTMVIVWLWLADNANIKLPVGQRGWKCAFLLNAACIVIAPLFYLNGLEEARLYFTEHMRFIGGLLPIFAGLLILSKLSFKPKALPVALFLSIILFFTGGVIGFLISGSNAVIPAHYHGSIVGITLAFMGAAYHLLGQYDYPKPSFIWQHRQLWIYGLGQLAHIIGLALMGGYGALRKSAGSAAAIETTIGKSLFFLGGSFAILGGLIFVVLAGRALLTKRYH